ncbi:MAG: hypothetical protein R3327_07860, partial [Nitrosopumilaceae archaeon]|nr:hypothetical protein [Nitrosopumilaceae archaeon]
MTMQIQLHDKSEQKINHTGRISVSRLGWVIRSLVVAGLIGVIIYNLTQGIFLADPLVAYSTIMPIHALLVVMIGWFFYKNP